MNLPTHRVVRRVHLAASAGLAGLVAVTGIALTSFSDGADELAPVAGLAYSNTTTTITGTPQVGQTVTADTSAWQPQASSYDYQWTASGAQIAGATARTLPLTADLVFQQIQVWVTPHTLLYDATPRLSQAVQVTPAPLSNTERPAIVGTPRVGETLSANEGTWSAAPDAFSYQWYLNGAAVDGATSQTWIVPESAGGQAAQVFVGATKAGYNPAYALSTGTAIEPAATTPPPAPVALKNTVGVSISGTPKVGETLTAIEGTWDPAATSYLYQWYLNGIQVDGATSKTWVVPASAEGQAAQVLVAALRDGYQPGYDISDGTPIELQVTPSESPSATSSPTPSESPSATTSPSESPTATTSPSETATTSPSPTSSTSPSESPSATATTSPSESPSPSATTSPSPTSSTSPSETTSASPSASPSASTSTSSSPSPSPTATQTQLKQFVFSTAPRMTGRPLFDYVLSYVRPTMSPAPAVVAFRWLRDGVPIRYATANRYRIRYRDRGHVIRLRITYARDYYATVRKVTNGKLIR